MTHAKKMKKIRKVQKMQQMKKMKAAKRYWLQYWVVTVGRPTYFMFPEEVLLVQLLLTMPIKN